MCVGMTIYLHVRLSSRVERDGTEELVGRNWLELFELSFFKAEGPEGVGHHCRVAARRSDQ